MSTYISYLRVSTTRQGQSGLGLAAQQEAVLSFVRDESLILESFVEVESGRKPERPQLAAALDRCRQVGATLLIAKLDRLARDVAVISALMKSDVRFTAVDMPQADTFRLHIEAAIAEEEGRKISDRTRAALAAAKARGVKLGGFRGRAPSTGDRIRAAVARAENARRRARQLLPIIDELRRCGPRTLLSIAIGLNERGIPAPRGGRWSPMQVSRVIKRGSS